MPSEVTYLAIARGCGCVRGFVHDDPRYPNDTAESVAEFIVGGMLIEAVDSHSEFPERFRQPDCGNHEREAK